MDAGAGCLLEAFVSQMEATFGANLASIVLCGSYARGDFTEDSDLDVYCFFDRLSQGDLAVVGTIIRALSHLMRNTEFNVQCMTLREYHDEGFARAFVSPIEYFESRVLHGTHVRPAPAPDELIPVFETLISETIMSIRHYITSQEPAERLSDGRLRRFALKPLCMALRAERYITTGTYPQNLNALMAQSSGWPKAKAVAWMSDKSTFDKDTREHPTHVLSALLDIARDASRRVSEIKRQPPHL